MEEGGNGKRDNEGNSCLLVVARILADRRPISHRRNCRPRVDQFFTMANRRCRVGQAKRSPTSGFAAVLVGPRFACPTLPLQSLPEHRVDQRIFVARHGEDLLQQPIPLLKESRVQRSAIVLYEVVPGDSFLQFLQIGQKIADEKTVLHADERDAAVADRGGEVDAARSAK